MSGIVNWSFYKKYKINIKFLIVFLFNKKINMSKDCFSILRQIKKLIEMYKKKSFKIFILFLPNNYGFPASADKMKLSLDHSTVNMDTDRFSPHNFFKKKWWNTRPDICPFSPNFFLLLCLRNQISKGKSESEWSWDLEWLWISFEMKSSHRLVIKKDNKTLNMLVKSV